MEKQNKTEKKAPALHAMLTKRYAAARYVLLLVVAFTTINLLLWISQTFAVYIPSAYLPFFLLDIGMFFGGRYAAVDSALYKKGYGLLGEGFFFAMLLLVVLLVAFYFLCFLLSDKRPAFLFAGLIFFAADTVFMLLSLLVGMEELSTTPELAALLMDYLLHALALFWMVSGILAHRRLQAAAHATPAEATAPAQH